MIERGIWIAVGVALLAETLFVVGVVAWAIREIWRKSR